MNQLLREEKSKEKEWAKERRQLEEELKKKQREMEWMQGRLRVVKSEAENLKISNNLLESQLKEEYRRIATLTQNSPVSE